VSGRFWFYRRRRLLPFLAAYALVCINGATLVPFVIPAESAAAATGLPDDAHARLDSDAWRWLEYQRGTGPEREPVVAAAVPPIVKNLRRLPTSQHARTAPAAHDRHVTDTRIPRPELMQQALAANAADLSRLCRLLL
jgi:hypothetical protein